MFRTTLSRAAVLVLAAGAAAGAAAAPATADTGTALCRVRDTTQGTQFASSSGAALTDAIAAAHAGDWLRVAGTCTGTFVVDKNLTLVGTSTDTSQATLDGAGSGPVLTVPAVLGGTITAVVQNLAITGGRSGFAGGGIVNAGNLTVNRSTVTGNDAVGGGGMINYETLALNYTTVSGNHATQFDGGGIYNTGDLTVNRSTVRENTAVGGGGGIFNESTATVIRTQVIGNTASGGGGISSVGPLTLYRTVFSGNVPDDCAC